MICFHKWEKWSKATDTYHSEKQQVTRCVKCHALRLRTFRARVSVDASFINSCFDWEDTP